MLVISKIAAAILLALLRLLAGLLPLKIHQKLTNFSPGPNGEEIRQQKQKRMDAFLSIFLCFGAGLLLSTCFIHMLPEVRLSFQEAAKVGGWPDLDRYPVAGVVICTGFFAVYLLEELGKRLTKRGSPEIQTISNEQTTSPLLFGVERASYSRNGGTTDIHVPVSSNEGNSTSITAAIRGFLLVAALSFHSIFEGMAIGLEPTLSDVWFLFTAVIIHELPIMFCIGMEMLASKLRILLYVIYMIELGLITSIGVGVGIVVTEYVKTPSANHILVIAILQGIATGTLLYVTFLELLERERQKPENGLVKLGAIAIGFYALTAIEVFTIKHAVDMMTSSFEEETNRTTPIPIF